MRLCMPCSFALETSGPMRPVELTLDRRAWRGVRRVARSPQLAHQRIDAVDVLEGAKLQDPAALGRRSGRRRGCRCGRLSHLAGNEIVHRLDLARLRLVLNRFLHLDRLGRHHLGLGCSTGFLAITSGLGWGLTTGAVTGWVTGLAAGCCTGGWPCLAPRVTGSGTFHLPLLGSRGLLLTGQVFRRQGAGGRYLQGGLGGLQLRAQRDLGNASSFCSSLWPSIKSGRK